jgi:hypothetical protein
MDMNRDVWTREFVLLVERMRTEQKQFFSTKQPIHLQKSKAYEKEVDKVINEFKLGGAPQPASTQTSLFDNNG